MLPYSLPVAVALGGTAIAALGPAQALEAPVVTGAGAAVACIAGIGALSQQQSARLGNVLAMGGVALGLGATFVAAAAGGGGRAVGGGGDLEFGASATATVAAAAAASHVVQGEQFALAAALLGGGGAVGWKVASKVSPIELPQTVAGFHALVGVAAVAAAIGEYLAHRSSTSAEELGVGSLVALCSAVVIGGITTTGLLSTLSKQGCLLINI